MTPSLALADLGRDWTDAARAGDHAAAHAISDTILQARAPASRDDPALPYHQRWVWDGVPPDGRRVLVRCYHGLGDTLQFARFLAPIRARAAHLTVEAQPALLPLLADHADRLVAFDPAAPLPAAPCTLEIMEVFHLLRIAPADLPGPMPYLRAAPDASPGRAIGLCLRAGGWDPARSIPPAAAAALLAQPWADLRQGARDISAVARLVAGLDLVVTVDTMVAHLAGALGRPTFLLLRHDADWRWGLGQTTPWYPTLRLFRQAREGDWTAPIAAALRAAG